MKIKQNLQKHKSDKAQRKKDYKKTKIDQNDKQTKSRAKRKAQTGSDRPPPGVRAAKKKKVENDKDRLKKFRLATMTGPEYICVSCHILCFRHSVVRLTEDLEKEIDSNFEDPDDWISDRNLVTKIHIEGVNLSVPAAYKNSDDYCEGGERYLCKTCLLYLRTKKRLPPCSVMNGLQLQETDQQLREQNLMLTDIEAAMVAPLVAYQIIRKLPKSQWGNLHNTSILVPIKPDTITETLGKMPRTPSGAGLIPVKFKRKVSYENSHYNQKVDPEKLFSFLRKVKEHGNPFYDDVGGEEEEETNSDRTDILEEFKQKCKMSDKRGSKFVYDSDDDSSDDEAEEETELSKAERETEELREKEEEENDVIKKFQLPYNTTVGLMDNSPEIIVAPGEGQKPVNSLVVKHWEVKAFPHLFNPDGSGGYDDERKYPIRLQDYIKTRLLSVEARFRQTATYLFAVCSHLESRRISSNIAMVGRRGKESVIDGQTTYQLEDAFKVTANVPNGPDYNKKLKSEMLARLDTLGAFQFFFTLSCADLRWDAIFASILLEHGYSVNFKCESVNGVFTVEVEARTEQGDWKPIEDFIKEDVDKSYHELVRNNVLLATRYFDHRLKQFISHIVMATSNVMCVISYTWRIEMQGRGAPHAHGTLHCCLEKLENLILVDGQLDFPPDNPLPRLVSEPDEEYSERPLRSDNSLPQLVSDPDEECERPLKGLEEAFRKLKADEPLTEEDIKPLVNFIDAFVTVSTHVGTVGEDVAKIALQVQKHRHTACCRKKNTLCRFHFPRPPAPHTILRIPVKKEERAKYVEAEKLIDKVMDIVTNPKIIEEIMGKYDKDSEEAGTDHQEKRELRIREVCERAGVEYNDYLSALALSGSGYTYHLARDIDEIYINPFNPEWLRAWDGNMDLQVTLDFYAVITYITDYFTKGEPAVIKAMMEALKDNKSPEVRENMKRVAGGYVKQRQIGESEAIYRILPTLYLSKSNVKCKFALTGYPQERSHMFLQATEKQIQAGVECIHIAGKDGLWYEQPDLYNKYLRRPAQLDNLCYAQFVMMYDSASSNNSKDSDDNNIEEDNEVDEEKDDQSELADVADTLEDTSSYYKYNHMMTYLDNGNKGLSLPKLIELSDPVPGEARKMRRRKQAAALRQYKGGRNEEPERFMYRELMLYTPRREEIPTDKEAIVELYNEEYEGERKVAIVKRQVMPHLECVEEARYMVEELQKELDLTETAVNLDPEAAQDNEECAEIGETDHPDFVHLDPTQLEYINTETNNDKQPAPFKRIELPPDDELWKRVMSLDKFQAEVLNIVVKYCRDLVKARKVGNPPPVAPLLIVTGGAGSGKSTVINVCANITQKILEQDGDDLDCPHVLKLAFTGTAASKIGGNTLHTTFNFSFGRKDSSYTGIDSRKLDMKRAQLKNLSLVIIDEISMVKSELLYALDARLQEIKQKYGKPFGGVAVMFFGDLMQLKPVQGNWIFDKPNSQQFRPVHTADPRWPMFKSIVLEENHRQGENKDFADRLNRMRVGEQTDEDLDLLETRVRKDGDKDLEKVDLFIGCTRDYVSKCNSKYIKSLPGDMITLKSINFAANKKALKPRIDDKDGTIGGTGFKDEIQVKEGAKVILIYNIDTSDSLTNGQLGKLEHIIWTKQGSPDMLVIRFNEGGVGEKNRAKNPQLSAKHPGCCFIERHKCQYSLSSRGGSTATVVQFPIWLAHAITCHKIQGQSIAPPQTVAIELETYFPAGGPLAYVGCSRVENFSQLFIHRSLPRRNIRYIEEAKTETKRLEDQSWNNNLSPWMTPDSNSLKIASVNIARLQPHLQNIRSDDRLLKADIIHVQETWLSPDPNINTTLDLHVDNFHSHFVSVGPGKGIGSFYRDSAATFQDHKSETFQVSKLTVHNVASINVYRSVGTNQNQLVSVLTRMIDESQGQAILISGDLNICTMTQPNNPVTRALTDLGFQQLVDVATHIRGGHIDHLYWKDPTGVWRQPRLSLETNEDWPERFREIERYSPYYTDHDAWLVTLQKQEPSQ